jgi:uncharacterized protein YndB with AHSA1/START domain
MEHEFTLTKEIAAAPEVVFRALTEPAELDRWWTTSAESEPRSGGRFDYRWEFSADAGREDHRQSGAYDEVVANERLAYPWEAAGRTTRVEVTVAPNGAGTLLRLAHTDWGAGEEAAESARMHGEGWGFFLDNLQSYLELGEDRRAEVMKLKARETART